MYTIEQWEVYSDMYSELETFAFNYIKEFGAKREDVLSVYVINGMITIETEESWNYGGHDTNMHSLPLEYLCHDDWITKEHDRLKSIRIDEEKAKHQQLIDARNKEIEKEKALFLQLQTKYGDT